MKCVNCGANLVIDNSRMLKYCPYCGQEIELHEEEPQNMASAISGIAKSLLSQRAEQQRFNRDHAAEIRGAYPQHLPARNRHADDVLRQLREQREDPKSDGVYA